MFERAHHIRKRSLFQFLVVSLGFLLVIFQEVKEIFKFLNKIRSIGIFLHDPKNRNQKGISMEQRIRQIYKEYSASLLYYARSLLKCEADAEEVLQNLFLGLVQHPQKLNDIQHLKGYLFAGVRKESQQLIRSKHRYEERLETFNTLIKLRPKDTEKSSEETAILEEALKQLPPEQKEAVILKHFSQLSFQEIAEVVGVSLSTISSRYRYAVQKLKEKVAKSVH